MDRARWDALCARLGLSLPPTCFDELEASYGGKARHYHDAEHVDECLALLDEVRSRARRPDHVEFALWLHDVVYSPRKSDNEERSADVAARWMTDGGADAESVVTVRDLILATRHGEVPSDPDERLLTDIDLHVLGTEPERFDRYDRDVRREYWWVPKPLYEHKRADILLSFLDREPLYQTDVLRSRFEARARENLERTLDRLGRP